MQFLDQIYFEQRDLKRSPGFKASLVFHLQLPAWPYLQRNLHLPRQKVPDQINQSIEVQDISHCSKGLKKCCEVCTA